MMLMYARQMPIVYWFIWVFFFCYRYRWHFRVFGPHSPPFLCILAAPKSTVWSEEYERSTRSRPAAVRHQPISERDVMFWLSQTHRHLEAHKWDTIFCDNKYARKQIEFGTWIRRIVNFCVINIDFKCRIRYKSLKIRKTHIQKMYSRTWNHT